MTALTPVTSIKAPYSFGAVISPDEILQLSGNKISIISARSGRSKHSYFLPGIPRSVTMNKANPSRLAMVYAATPTQNEVLAVVDTYTGNSEKQYVLKNSSQSFQLISLGVQLCFVVNSAPHIVYYAQMGTADTPVGQYDVGGQITYLCANQSLIQTGAQFIALNTLRSWSFGQTIIYFRGGTATHGSQTA